MPISHMKDLVRDAAGENRAVGAFSVGNMEMILGAVKAAEELNTPIILQIAQIRLNHSPLELMGPMMIHAARQAKVPVAVHLDHGLTFEVVRQALDLGFTSVMFDGSKYDFQKNIDLTRHVMQMSAETGANVEAELGVVGGSEGGGKSGKIVCTDPDSARRFAKETGIDLLAVAIGNAHGHYAAAPKLRLDILNEIHDKVDIPLVLHGGSGISAQEFRDCIDRGISKINIATASFDALTAKAEKYFSKPGPHDYFQLNEAMIEGVYENVRRHILIFNNRVPLDQIGKSGKEEKAYEVSSI